MAIVKKPNKQAVNFIEKSGKDSKSENKTPVMIRIDPIVLERIDTVSKELGISRSAFICLSASEKLKRLDE
jgi:hypothetical protein